MTLKAPRKNIHRCAGLQVEGAEELREKGALSDGAVPLWMPSARSGLLPLLPRYLTHLDLAAEAALIHPDAAWLRDHMAARMVRCSACVGFV